MPDDDDDDKNTYYLRDLLSNEEKAASRIVQQAKAVLASDAGSWSGGARVTMARAPTVRRAFERPDDLRAEVQSLSAAVHGLSQQIVANKVLQAAEANVLAARLASAEAEVAKERAEKALMQAERDAAVSDRIEAQQQLGEMEVENALLRHRLELAHVDFN